MGAHLYKVCRSVLRQSPAQPPTYGDDKILRNADSNIIVRLDPDQFTCTVNGTVDVYCVFVGQGESRQGRGWWLNGTNFPITYTPSNPYATASKTAGAGFSGTKAVDGSVLVGAYISSRGVYLNRRSANQWQITLEMSVSDNPGLDAVVGFWYFLKSAGQDPRGAYTYEGDGTMEFYDTAGAPSAPKYCGLYSYDSPGFTIT